MKWPIASSASSTTTTPITQRVGGLDPFQAGGEVDRQHCHRHIADIVVQK
jgi:hypothetical protein